MVFSLVMALAWVVLRMYLLGRKALEGKAEGEGDAQPYKEEPGPSSVDP